MTATASSTAVRGALAQAPRPVLRRRAERILLTACSGFDVLMASVTFFVYSGWFRDVGYQAFEKAGQTSSLGVVNGAVSVVNVYAGCVLAIGVMSFLVSRRGLRPGSTGKGVAGWLIFCSVFSLVTADFIGILLYTTTWAVYAARSRAARRLG